VTWLEADAGADARYRALDALPAGEASLPRLLAALKDESWRVRRLAADRLAAAAPGPEVVRQLVALLGERGDPGARNAAATVLSQLGAAALPGVVALLAHPDPDQRKFACDVLANLRRYEAAGPLVAALADADDNVRTAAAEALGHLGGPEARRALAGLLTSRDVMLRVCALEGLARLGEPPALPALLALVADPLTRRSAWKLLVHVDHPTAWLLVARGLAVRESRDAVLAALGARGRPFGAEEEGDVRAALGPVRDAVAWLQAGLEAAEDDRRRGAVIVARALAAPSLALAVAAAARTAADARLVQAALEAFGSPGARALLSSPEGLADLPSEARAVAAEALVQLAEPAHVPLLVALLDAGDGELAELAVRALGRTHARDAVRPLLGALEDDALAAHAWRALVQLAGTWPDEVRAALHTLVAGRLRPHVVRAWAEVAGPRAADLLRRALNDRDPAVRAAAVDGAGHAPKETLGILRAALMDESALVRHAAARLLPAVAAAEAHALLPRALADADAAVLAAACEAAARLGAAERAERLRELARQPDAAVAIAALDALAVLGLLGDETLLRAVAHPDPDVLARALELGADRALLLDRALAALGHASWNVRVAAAGVLAVSGGPAALGPLQEAEAREADEVAREALAAAVLAVGRRR
jgi:HEAT repeat protein